ncbi:uncharacterized protein RSE6_01967 [Rhynchosporium secalis]|uniref:Uncharacterized protein n=1 Tax=Rhynchosporium secalis TaxID=38038 RepID=A0A1E1LZ31_RHYSE|nr:uncharacterized protein RSE6_01967 [Rhynchosporium secalis]
MVGVDKYARKERLGLVYVHEETTPALVSISKRREAFDSAKIADHHDLICP